MSRHLNSKAATDEQVAELRAKLFGAHKPPKPATLSAMAAMHRAAQPKEEPMSQYTEEDIDVFLAQGKRSDEKDESDIKHGFFGPNKQSKEV